MISLTGFLSSLLSIDCKSRETELLLRTKLEISSDEFSFVSYSVIIRVLDRCNDEFCLALFSVFFEFSFHLSPC